MPGLELRRSILILAVFASLQPATATAQPYRFGIDVGVSGMSSFPSQLEDACQGGKGIAPSLRGHFRPHWLVGVEAGASLQFTVGGNAMTDCGGLPIPWVPGESRVIRRYDATRGSARLATEGRLIITPTGRDPAALRMIGGSAVYPGDGVYAWIVGLGIAARRSWGNVTVDGERWRVGTRWAEGTVTYGQDGPGPWEPQSTGREWEGLWQIRIGFVVWAR